MLAATVAEAARRFAATPVAVTEDARTLTYAELDQRSDATAAVLAARGVRSGDLIALVLPSDLDYLVTYCAAAKLGAATAGINPRLTATERGHLVTSTDAALVVAAESLAELLPGDRETMVLADHELAVAPELGANVAEPPAPPPLAPDPQRLVAVVFTSGTTGAPKAAEFTEANLAAITAADVGDAWGGGGPLLVATAFAHVGFMTKLPWYLRLGSTLHLLSRWRAPTAIATIARHRIASLGGVAAQLELILRCPDLDEHDLSCVRTIVMGGAASPPRLVREARERLGAAYSIRYSSTESGGVGTATAFDAPDAEALHTVGRARPGVTVEVLDPDGRPAGTDTAGELCLRSPTVMRGYRHAPEATAAVLRDGWLHTGDVGTIDADGLVRVAGRLDDRYIRGGYNVDPAEVEAALADHAGVERVVVLGRPDPVMGAVGLAVVVPTEPNRPPSLESLRRHGGERLAPWKLPEGLEVVAELPLTAMDKLDRRALAADLASDADDRC